MYEKLSNKEENYVGVANEITGQILNYSHEEQVQIVNQIRQNLIKERSQQNDAMAKAHEENAANIGRHQEGTKMIASGL